MPQIYRDDDHDTIVRKFAETIEKNNPGKYRVVFGSDTTTDEGSGTIIPDLSLYMSDGNKPVLAIEVETSQTVEHSQADSRWKAVANLCPLQIVVPKGMRNKANSLCKRSDLKAKIIEY